MPTHAEKIHARLSGSGVRAPRDITWAEFESFWKEVADEVVEEKGDRLAVTMNGHRQVFRRQHDGLVSIEDVELARHLLAAQA